MTKLINALMLACAGAVVLGVVTAAVTPAQEIKFDRSAVVLDKKGTVVHNFGGHRLNPFASRAECEYGIDGDKVKITEFLMLNGVDPEDIEVVVTCAPAGYPS